MKLIRSFFLVLLLLYTGTPLVFSQSKNPFRYLLEEENWKQSFSLKTPVKPEVVSQVNVSRRKRWNVYQKIRWTLKEWEHFKEDKYCSSQTASWFKDIEEKINKFQQDFIDKCLYVEKWGTSCSAYENRVTEIYDLFIKLNGLSGNCGVGIAGTSELKMSIQARSSAESAHVTDAYSPSYQVFVTDLESRIQKNNTLLYEPLGWRQSIDFSGRFQQAALYDYAYHLLWAQSWGRKSPDFQLKWLSERTIVSEPIRGQNHHWNFQTQNEIQSEVHWFLQNFALDPRYTYVRRDSSSGLYAGNEHRGEVDLVLSDLGGLKRILRLDYELFLPDTGAYEPTWESVRFGVAFRGDLIGGGSGKLNLGLDQRKVKTQFLGVFPFVELEFETERLPSLGWFSDRGTYMPTSTNFILKAAYKPEVNFWSAMTQILRVAPALKSYWGDFSTQLDFDMKLRNHKADPGGFRRDALGSVGLEPGYFWKPWMFFARVAYERALIFEGSPRPQLWDFESSYESWKILGGARYEF